VPARAVAVSNQQVSVPLQSNAYLFQRFRRGYQLRVNAVGQSFLFNLTGTSQALSDLLTCTQQHVVASAPSPGTNPFASSSPTSTAPVRFSAEATALIANVLSQAGITGFHILEPNEKPKEWAQLDAVWA